MADFFFGQDLGETSEVTSEVGGTSEVTSEILKVGFSLDEGGILGGFFRWGTSEVASEVASEVDGTSEVTSEVVLAEKIGFRAPI